MSTTVPSTSPSRAPEVPVAHKSRSAAHPRRKTRHYRRRGRGKDELGSDEEIVREVGTDSETEDDLSTTDSDSDTEPVSEGPAADGRSRPLTPSTSDSPQSHSKDIPAHIDDNPQPFFAQPSTWEDMVAEESTHGPADLPVIDFTDFSGEAVSDGHAPRPLSRRSKTPLDGSRDRSPRSETKADDRGGVDRRRSTSRRSRSSASKRLAGQSARQAYQHRLESDPSFVPTVGGFWGHDERLLDKDLRSLSGWWRGRWQNRGRGRGMAMRGRAGHGQGPTSHEADGNGNLVDLPPIERPWTHDGFEEMKRKEEQRRAALQQQQQQQANQTRGGHGGRGGFVANRGGRGGMAPGGPVPSPSRPHTTPAQGRIWFAMKPELMWTRQHEAFLFFDSSTKPRNGQGATYRVKLPGCELRLAQSAAHHVRQELEWPKSELRADASENVYTIRIPKVIQPEKVIEPLTTVEETSLEEIFTVRPNLVTPVPIPIPKKPSTTEALPDKSPPSTADQGQKGAHAEQTLLSQLETLSIVPPTSDQARLARTEEAVLKKSPAEQSSPKQASSTNDQRPTLPPLQTVFTPPPGTHPSPAYAASYPYGPTLPPGVALNAHGMPYELATGRPVILAPPPPMFTPRPMMPLAPGAVPFIPTHMSPDFMSQPSSHTPPMNGFVDPATGTPLFSLPRQTRIEIRAPTGELFDGKGSRKGQSRPSNASTKAPSASSSSQSFDSSSQTFYPTMTGPAEMANSPAFNASQARDAQANGDLGNRQQPDSHMVSYPPYQPYYYPESYGYYPYLDMSQVGQYDAYSSDPRGAQGTTYY